MYKISTILNSHFQFNNTFPSRMIPLRKMWCYIYLVLAFWLFRHTQKKEKGVCTWICLLWPSCIHPGLVANYLGFGRTALCILNGHLFWEVQVLNIVASFLCLKWVSLHSPHLSVEVRMKWKCFTMKSPHNSS